MQEPDTNFSETLSDAIIGEIREILLIWEQEHYKEFPWRTTDQQWKSLIAEVLLQRTKANNVVPVYESFFEHFPSPEKLAQASEEEIQNVIYPLGLRWRTPLLKKLGEQLVQVQGELPDTLEGLLELHGVGAYVAAAWLGFHGGKRSVIIDANVVRWVCRLVDRSMDGETRRKKWLIELADKLTPEKNWKEYNYAVLDFSMEICTKKPQCLECPLGPAICLYRRKQIGDKHGTE
jgi:A/G-specific adenine glycosylase